MSFSMKFANSFSISKNASIEEYREFSGNIGRKLLEICKSNNLYIANSRIGKDKNISKKNLQ
jgi:hypothetical protein